MSATLEHLGRVDGMPHEAYLAVPAVGTSWLTRLRVSPYHLWADRQPGAPTREATAAMFAGTLAHCATLEPLEFERRYIVGPDLDRRTKQWREWVEMNVGDRTPITLAQKGTAIAQADSLREHPEIGELLSYPGACEVSVFWRDLRSGVACKARPDRVCVAEEGRVILLDVKTAKSAGLGGFVRNVVNLRYDLQAVHYSRGWFAATGEKVEGFVFAVVESDYPFASAVYMLSPELLVAAEAEVDRLLALYAECERLNRWPGYPTEPVEITPEHLPRWALAEVGIES